MRKAGLPRFQYGHFTSDPDAMVPQRLLEAVACRPIMPDGSRPLLLARASTRAAARQRVIAVLIDRTARRLPIPNVQDRAARRGTEV
jgi:hypothetical protein